jgi:hypothetical protein
MTFRLKIAFSSYIMISITAIASGLLYLLSSQIMPYHQQVIGRSWNDLDHRLQMMLLGFLRLGGLGMVSTGVSIGVLTLFPFRRGQKWAIRAIPLIGLIFYAPIAYGARALHYSTQASTPWKGVAIMSAILIAAYLLTIKSAEGTDPRGAGREERV